MAIYATELFREYDVQSIIRVGSAGALTEKVKIRDIVIASGACTDSGMNRIRFEGLDYAPVADFGCCSAAASAAGDRDDVHVGLIFSGDSFYPARPELMKRMVEHGVLAIEMEASALYTIAAGHGRRALAICTVSDHIVTGEETTAEERERTFGDMVEIALGGRAGRASRPADRRMLRRRRPSTRSTLSDRRPTVDGAGLSRQRVALSGVEILDSVVIGAGQAGLSTSYHLQRRGIDHVVLDADEAPGRRVAAPLGLADDARRARHRGAAGRRAARRAGGRARTRWCRRTSPTTSATTTCRCCGRSGWTRSSRPTTGCSRCAPATGAG